jgi:hypothetical protein
MFITKLDVKMMLLLNELMVLIFLNTWDQTIYTEKFRGIFSVGKHRNTVGCVGIIFRRPTLDKYRYFSAHFVVQKNMFYVIFYG